MEQQEEEEEEFLHLPECVFGTWKCFFFFLHLVAIKSIGAT